MVPQHRRLHSKAAKESGIVEQLRKAILDSGLTQYRIAKDSSVPQPVITRFVNGQRGINLESADKICRLLRLRLARYR